MNKFFAKIFIMSVLALTVMLNANLAISRERLERFDFEVNAGSRLDQFDWNIVRHTYGSTRDEFTELTWEDLEIYEINSKAKLIIVNNHYPFGGVAKVRVNYGEIQSGDNQESKYEFDDRVGEWSRSNNKANDGDVFDFTGGGGLVFRSRNGKITVSPMAGFSYHEQNLTMYDGYQTVSRDNPFSLNTADDPPPLGSILGLNNTYEADWNSGWVGVDLELKPMELVEIAGFVELHSARYRAYADWNLRSDLQHPISFEHESNDAVGFVTGVGAKIGTDLLLVNLDMLYQNWQAEDGIDTVYKNVGTTEVGRLNEVNWESFSVTAGLTVRF